MFSHVTIGSSDPNKVAKFYDAVLGVLGINTLFNAEGPVAYGQTTGPKATSSPKLLFRLCSRPRGE